MAKFPGPRFLLLVLAGLGLCESTTNTSTQPQVLPTNSAPISEGPNITKPVETATDNITTLPPSTLTQQHQSITPLNESDHITTLPPSTLTQQHQAITPLNELITPLNESATAVISAGIPPNTTMLQHQSNTTLNERADYSTTTLPPNTTMLQHPHSSIQMTTEESLNPSISDSPLTASTMNTTSPTPMPTTASVEDNRKCNYSLNLGKEDVEVKIDKNYPSEKYTFEFKDTENITVVHKETLSYNKSEDSFRIPYTLLKPCQKYRVEFSPSCISTSHPQGIFTTRSLERNDITAKVHENETKVIVSFTTKWNLGHDSIEVNDSNSCINYNVTFVKNICKESKDFPFTLPPAKPVIIVNSQIPASLFWVNNSSRCPKNLIYTCKNETHEVDVKDLKPFNDYICTGTYNHLFGDITRKINVSITCDVNNASITSITNSSITASWNITSQNCSEITKDFNSSVTCNDTKTRDQRPGVISNLKPYTPYMCNFSAKYENNQFYSHNITEWTKSSEPTVIERKVTEIGHNGFNVKCKIDDWNGDPGWINIMLWNSKHTVHHKCDKEKSCAFNFTDLYYLTEYNIKVIARNGNGNSREVYNKKHSTKYNDKAVLGFLGFLIVVTSLALLFVLYKIYILKRKKSRNEQEMDELIPANALLQVEPMSAEALLEAYKIKRADEGRLFMDEFQSIPRIFSNYAVREAKRPENQSKNRYVDILPYDYNRVPLSHGGTDDYINASFIEGFKETNKYIAAQGPKEETIEDFWTMIWEQNTSIIVMVTRCEEGNKNKCAQYWPSPDRETEIYDNMVVKLKGEEKCPDYIIRHLTLLNRKEKTAEREVTHIQFTSWPDHGVPSDPGLLLKLRRRVNSFKNFFSGPIVVHCSAGVGRTGTYIGIDAMIESLDAEGRVDIYGYVVRLRRQRCLMVQVETQYVLIHTALIEYSQFGETEMSLSDFHSEVNTLRQKEGNEMSLMEMEFQKLPKFKNYRSANMGRSEENKKKNRSSVMPYDFNRVQIKLHDEASHDSDADDEEEYSSDEDDEVPTKYINASHINGYWCPSSLIVAQGPMANTVADFLHMLYQKKVKSVFMLSDCIENDKEFCSQYWDDEKKTFEEMVVEVKETENTPTYVRRCLEIQHTKRKDSHTLQQYHFLKWAGHEVPENPLDLVNMMKSARQSSDSSKNLPIVAHCNDGSSRSGIFCALWNLLDSADSEKLVDIFQVSKDLRKARLGMINSLEQYDFLYAAVDAAYPMQNGEVKKAGEAPADSVQVVNESTALISLNTEVAAKESTNEGTDSVPPEEGATEPNSEPEKDLSESTSNGPVATVEA